MESFFSRYRNLVVLLAALLLQVIGLAVQVRKPGPSSGSEPVLAASQKDGRSVRLIRLWAAEMVTPFERAIHGSGQGMTGLWSNYIDLRNIRNQNKELLQTVDRLRLEQATLREDALQGQRLQGLLKFQESYIYKTTAAQVIGTSGSIQNHVISDQTSGAGVVLETTRIRGILRGNAAGQPQVVNILADQRIQRGEHVLTAGGDQIFPRGLPVGVVERVEQDRERGSFINVIIKPAANLQHLDEVLVITSLQAHLSAQEQADLTTSEELKGAEVAAEAARKKAAAEMAERLPGLTDPNDPNAPKAAAGADAKKADGSQPASGPPLPPVAPKPLQPKHADRFSPGASDSTGSAEDSSDAPATEDGGAKAVTPKPGKPKSANPKPTNPKPTNPKPTNPKQPGGNTAGRLQ